MGTRVTVSPKLIMCFKQNATDHFDTKQKCVVYDLRHFIFFYFLKKLSCMLINLS